MSVKNEKEKTSDTGTSKSVAVFGASDSSRRNNMTRINYGIALNKPDIGISDVNAELKRGGVDTFFLVLVLILMAFGSVMVFSASSADALARFGDSLYFAKKQVIFVCLSVFVVIISSSLSYRVYFKLANLLYLITIGMLVLVIVIGFASGGAQRWFSLFGISIQPSEIAKVTLVMALARYFSINRDRVRVKRNIKELKKEANLGKANKRSVILSDILYGIIIPLGYLGIIDVLVMLEDHISGLSIITMIAIVVMFYSGVKLRYLVATGIAGAGAVSVLIAMKPYALDRVRVWLDPYSYKLEGGWQTIQGLYAIGSGGLFGLGLGNSRLKYSYVSQPQNDFIFTIVCEELGLLGALALIFLFALLVWRGYRIAATAPDAFASITAFGISTHIAIQVILNVAVVTNMMPNTGISLPFFSYGGSSLLVLAAEMGIILSISRYSYIRK